jgi:putative transposase
VFRPKYNVSVFRNWWVRNYCEKVIREICVKYSIIVYELKVMPDHVHMFVGLPPTMPLSKAFQLIKGGSARMIFKKCKVWKAFFSLDGKRKPHLWSPGKFYRSVGNVKADVIEHYIAHSNKWDFEYLNKQQKSLKAY